MSENTSVRVPPLPSDAVKLFVKLAVISEYSGATGDIPAGGLTYAVKSVPYDGLPTHWDWEIKPPYETPSGKQGLAIQWYAKVGSTTHVAPLVVMRL